MSFFDLGFIEERKQLEYDRKLATAETVKRHRQQKKVWMALFRKMAWSLLH